MKFKVFNIRLTDGFREQDEATLNQFLETVVVKRVFASVVHAGVSLWSVLLYYDEANDSHVEAIAEGVEEEAGEQDLTLSPAEEHTYNRLKHWRNERAMQEGLAPYMIAHNAWLKAMVKLPAQTLDDLRQIKGFGEKRVRKYGDEILHILNGEPLADKPLYLDF